MKKIILSLLIIAGLFTINTAAVYACSCTVPVSPKESLGESTSVFVGKVIDIDTPSSIGFSVSSADPVKVTFEVFRIWKGPDYKNLVITTARSGVSCGYSFKQGEEYIVYAYGEDSNLSTGICSRTKVLANAQEDLEGLGEGNLPTNLGSNDLSRTSDFVSMLLILAGLIVLIGVVRLAVKKYKK